MKTELYTLAAIQAFTEEPSLPKNIAVLNPHSPLPSRIIKDLDSGFFYINEVADGIIMQLDRAAIDTFISYALAGCPKDHTVPENPDTQNKNDFFRTFSANLPDGFLTIRLDNDPSSLILSAMHRADVPDLVLFIVTDHDAHHVPIMDKDILAVNKFLTTPIQLPLQPIRHD